MRVGVLGGTFDPVHVAHLVLAEQARDQLGLDLVLFVPAGDPWRKSHREITHASHRLAMLKLAIDDNDAFGISDVELKREGPSYTADTLSMLAAERLDDEFYFIVGADALADLPNWHEPERIVRHAMLAVAPRTGERIDPATLHLPLPGDPTASPGRADRPASPGPADLNAAPGRADRAAPSDLTDRTGTPDPANPTGAALLPGLADRIVEFHMPRIDISSSDIRDRHAAARSIRYLVPDPVRLYIESHNLYR